MSQIINLSQTKDSLNENLNLLLSLNPTKLNYSLKEVANITNLSYDFIRNNVLSEKIQSIRFGTKYQINVHEVARILKEGI
jgi:excisionase family DNA binding protein